MRIVPFEDALLDEAALLLAARQRENRRAEAALPARFEEPEAAREALASVWAAPGASGVVALRDGRLSGYLIGAPQVDTVRGRTIWVRHAGHALAPGEDAELYRDLYAAASSQWLARGCFAHYALIPAMDQAALEAWFSLSFGKEQTHGLLEVVEAEEAAGMAPTPYTIRRAGPDDLAALLEVADVVAIHQAGPPVYAVFLSEMRADWQEGYAELLASEDITVWIAERAGHVLGFQVYVPQEAKDNLTVPERCVELHLAATRAEERGHGLGRALTAHGLRAARAAGYAYCATDWRVTNLLSSRFWPRRGFRPVAYRLFRQVDERIAWARG
jgi:ribosomal protein S18 acetylase RimI-like enzyme